MLVNQLSGIKLAFPCFPLDFRAVCVKVAYFLKIIFNVFTDLFLAVLGLRCFAQAFSSCGEQGQPLKAVHRLLVAVTSLRAGPGLQAAGALECGLSSGSARA